MDQMTAMDPATWLALGALLVAIPPGINETRKWFRRNKPKITENLAEENKTDIGWLEAVSSSIATYTRVLESGLSGVDLANAKADFVKSVTSKLSARGFHSSAVDPVIMDLAANLELCVLRRVIHGPQVALQTPEVLAIEENKEQASAAAAADALALAEANKRINELVEAMGQSSPHPVEVPSNQDQILGS